jgi:histidine ammonia-lyase
MSVTLDGHSLTLKDFMRAVRGKEEVNLSEEAVEKVNHGHDIIKHIIEEGRTVYGVNTGFGKLSDVAINKSELSKLQENLLKSHACGVGPCFDEEVVRGMMVLRVNALAKGFSGIRIKTIRQLIEYLNKNIIPVIPEQGSLGASGDLAPLSHMGLTLIGLGEVFYQSVKMSTLEALQLAGIDPLPKLVAKEGLSLINGTQAMTSVGAITLYDAIQLSKQLDVAGAMTLEALNGITDAFSPLVHQARGHIGQIHCAENVMSLVHSSKNVTTQGEIRVQDAYSLRCMAQVHGASKDAFNYILQKVETEMNAATDNPLVFDIDHVISGGNFHGQPMAISFDFMKVAIAEMASISERRIERLVNPHLNEGLPPFLVADGGLNSGFMIVQYSAASLVSENKVLAHPASVDSISSSANQEDHVSMGTIAARGARDILNNTKKVVAMELFTAAQAIDLRGGADKLGIGTKAAYDVIRSNIPFVSQDEIMHLLINKTIELVQGERILHKVEEAIENLF